MAEWKDLSKEDQDAVVKASKIKCLEMEKDKLVEKFNADCDALRKTLDAETKAIDDQIAALE